MTTHQIVYISTFLIFFGTAADVIDMIVDEGCQVSTVFTLTEDHSYNVIWNGGVIRSWCHLTFTGGSRERRQRKYTLCVKAKKFNVTDDAFELKFYKGHDIDFSKIYNNNSNLSNIHFCAPEDEYLDIKFYQAQQKTNSYVKLVVSANITSEASERGTPTDFQLVIPLGSGILMIFLVIVSMTIRRHRFVRNVSHATAGTNHTGILAVNSNRIEMNPRHGAFTEHVEASVPVHATTCDNYAPPSYAESCRVAPPSYEEVTKS